MKKLEGKVAVITGAASGIGKGIAQQLAKEGMKLVLADIEERSLAEAEKELRAAGTHTLAVVTDVSKREAVFTLADRAPLRILPAGVPRAIVSYSRLKHRDAQRGKGGAGTHGRASRRIRCSGSNSYSGDVSGRGDKPRNAPRRW